MVMLRIDMKQQLLHLWFLKMLDQAQSSIDLNQEMEWLKTQRVFEKLEAMKILLMIKLIVLSLLNFWMLRKRLKKFDVERFIRWWELIKDESFHVVTEDHLLWGMDLKSHCIILKRFTLSQVLVKSFEYVVEWIIPVALLKMEKFIYGE